MYPKGTFSFRSPRWTSMGLARSMNCCLYCSRLGSGGPQGRSTSCWVGDWAKAATPKSISATAPAHRKHRPSNRFPTARMPVRTMPSRPVVLKCLLSSCLIFLSATALYSPLFRASAAASLARFTPAGTPAPSAGSAPDRRPSSRAPSRRGRGAPGPRRSRRSPCARPGRSP
jgi:hypothetical protein